MTLPNSPKPSIVFFGNERLATGVTTQTPVLNALIEAGYPIEAVIVNHDQATSRKQRVLEVETVAFDNNLRLFAPNTKEALASIVSNLNSPIAILAAYGQIIPKSIIKHFKHGILNVHPSALPKYRGSTPLESIILDGAKSTTVSLMQLSVKMDAGDIYAQEQLNDIDKITKQGLADAVGALGAQMVINVLPQILDANLTPQPQDESQATFTKQINKQDGKIDWTKSAVEIEREIRAYAGWPGSSTEINAKSVIITAAQVIDYSGTPGIFFVHDHQLAAYCGDKALLITKLKPAGKNAMPSRDFLAGNPIS